jgi:hypothetical protein
MTQDKALSDQLARLALALERLAPPAAGSPEFDAAEALIWASDGGGSFLPVLAVNRLPLALLKGIDGAARQLLDNTRRFAEGLPANNALLWGARGMGKSSLVKSVHWEVRKSLGARRGQAPRAKAGEPAGKRARAGSDPVQSDLKLIEIHREDIGSLPRCLALLRPSRHRFIVFCDDLSFDKDDTSYKSLKAVLEGGIEGRPENVVLYATSNRRHLMPRELVENERSTAINPGDAVEEKVSLSDRFGLWLGFHNCDQQSYLDMVRSYAGHFGLETADSVLVREALEWSITRGSRSGRVAWQFIQDLAGREGKRLGVG